MDERARVGPRDKTKAGRGVVWVRRASSIPSDFVGIECSRALPRRQSRNLTADVRFCADAAGVDELPVEACLDAFPPAIRGQADRLRDLVRRAVPDVIERVRPGWRLIGYDIAVPGRSKPAYFAYVAPEPQHVHLGFEHGVLVDDPNGLLEGAHLRLRKVRFVTSRPGDEIPDAELVALVRSAARVAALPATERAILRLESDERLEPPTAT